MGCTVSKENINFDIVFENDENFLSSLLSATTTPAQPTANAANPTATSTFPSSKYVTIQYTTHSTTGQTGGCTPPGTTAPASKTSNPVTAHRIYLGYWNIITSFPV